MWSGSRVSQMALESTTKEDSPGIEERYSKYCRQRPSTTSGWLSPRPEKSVSLSGGRIVLIFNWSQTAWV